MVAFGPLQLLERLITALPFLSAENRGISAIAVQYKRATSVLLNWPPSGEEGNAAALLTSHGQCQLRAWQEALGPQSRLITWVVTVLDVIGMSS